MSITFTFSTPVTRKNDIDMPLKILIHLDTHGYIWFCHYLMEITTSFDIQYCS